MSNSEKQAAPGPKKGAMERSAEITAKATRRGHWFTLGGVAIIAITSLVGNFYQFRSRTEPAGPSKPVQIHRDKAPDASDLAEMLRPAASATPERVKETLKRLGPPNTLYEKAVQAIAAGRTEEARSIALEAESNGSIDHNSILWLKAVADFHDGNYASAKDLFEQIYKATPGNVSAIEDLGMLKYYTMDLSGASELFQKAVDIRETQNLVDPKTAESVSNLAASLLGDLDRSESLYWKSLALYSMSQHGESLEQVGVLSNLATIEFKKEAFSDAEHLFQLAIDMHNSLPTDEKDPVSLATFYNNLALAQERQGFNSKARANYRTCLELRETYLPKGHPDIADAMQNLANLEDAKTAEQLYRSAIKIIEDHFGKKSVNAGYAYISLASCLDAQGKNKEAKKYITMVRDICKSLPKDHPLVLELKRSGWSP